METFLKIIGKPAAWMYFILVVALLVIVSNNSGTIKDLRADIDVANSEITTHESTLEAMSNEIAIRQDAIDGLNGELDSVSKRLDQVASERGSLETAVSDLRKQLDIAVADPDCPTCPECPVVVTE